MTDDVLNAYKRLLNEQTSLMIKYRKLLSENESDEHLNVMLKNYPLFFPHMVVESRCPLAEKNSNFVANLMLNPNASNSGRQHLHDFTKDAKELIIADPYLFPKHDRNKSQQTYDVFKSNIQHYFTGAVNKSCVEKVHVITQKNYDKRTFRELQDRFKADGIDLTLEKTKYEESSIHDRIWIKNISDGQEGCRAKVVGSSLNGLDKQACFILDLPQEDLNGIIKFMGQHSLLGALQHHIRHFA